MTKPIDIHTHLLNHEIAALFVETFGTYFNIPNLDPWDITRNAMKYNGPHPVVAHPPCTLWGNMAAANYARWGGEHNKPGNDGGMFLHAMAQVEQWGGVLEHPAYSKAFAEYGIDKPVRGRWTESACGWVCEVWQSAYGHRANKKTWLYYCGNQPPFDLDWATPRGTHQIGYPDKRGKARNKPTLSKKEAKATPIAFRDALIMLAIHSRGEL